MHYFVKPKKILTLSTLTASPLSTLHCIIQLCCDTKKILSLYEYTIACNSYLSRFSFPLWWWVWLKTAMVLISDTFASLSQSVKHAASSNIRYLEIDCVFSYTGACWSIAIDKWQMPVTLYTEVVSHTCSWRSMCPAHKHHSKLTSWMHEHGETRNLNTVSFLARTYFTYSLTLERPIAPHPVLCTQNVAAANPSIQAIYSSSSSSSLSSSIPSAASTSKLGAWSTPR